jgi:natural product precursor
MKSEKTIKKLEFKKETIARLGQQDLSLFRGGQETENVTITRNNATCTCITHTSRREPCND